MPISNTFKRNKEAVKDTLLTVCTNCRYGIFPDHKYQWSKKGLIHIDCNNKRGVDALKNVSRALSKSR